MADLIIYTDGSSRGNPGPGGYGILLMYNNTQKSISQGFRLTTNNRMELMAVIVALQSLKKNNLPIHLYTDSKYVVDSIEKKWLNNWVKNDFKGGKKNKDLWLKYWEISKNFTIQLHWVKGHSDNPYNNHCDELATSAADGKDLLIDTGFEEANR